MLSAIGCSTASRVPTVPEARFASSSAWQRFLWRGRPAPRAQAGPSQCRDPRLVHLLRATITGRDSASVTSAKSRPRVPSLPGSAGDLHVQGVRQLHQVGLDRPRAVLSRRFQWAVFLPRPSVRPQIVLQDLHRQDFVCESIDRCGILAQIIQGFLRARGVPEKAFRGGAAAHEPDPGDRRLRSRRFPPPAVIWTLPMWPFPLSASARTNGTPIFHSVAPETVSAADRRPDRDRPRRLRGILLPRRTMSISVECPAG